MRDCSGPYPRSDVQESTTVVEVFPLGDKIDQDEVVEEHELLGDSPGGFEDNLLAIWAAELLQPDSFVYSMAETSVLLKYYYTSSVYICLGMLWNGDSCPIQK